MKISEKKKHCHYHRGLLFGVMVLPESFYLFRFRFRFLVSSLNCLFTHLDLY